MSFSLRDIVAKFRIVFDKTAGNKAEADAKQSIGGIESAAKKLGLALAAAFSVAKIAAFVKASLSAAIESEAIWNRVGGAVERSGASWAGMERKVRATAQALLDVAGIGDEQFGAAFDRLIGLTGDAEFALSQMGFAADIAAKFFGSDLGPAVDLLGKAYSGNTRALRQLGIATDDVNEGLRILRERVAGAAANELNTLEGKMRQLAEVAGDAREEFGFFIFRTLGGNETQVALNRFKLGLEGIGNWFKTHRLGSITVGGITMPWVFPIRAGAASGGGGGGGWGAPNAPALPPDPATAAAASAARTEAERRRMARANRDARTPRLAGAEGIQGGLEGGMMPLFGIDDLLEQSEFKLNDFWTNIGNVASNAAHGVSGAWQDTFALLLSGSATIGRTFETLGRGMGAALLGGLAQYASGKVAENVASGVEELAKGLAASANPFMAWSAPLHFSAAAEHGGAAALWSVLAGASGAAQSAVAGGGRGGMSGGVPSGATDIGGRIAQTTTPKGPDINVYLDPISRNNAGHQSEIGEAARRYAERYGGQIVYHTGGGK